MPVYTYRCESCGVQFDIHQSFKDDPLTQCPECEEKSLRKVYLPVGIVFKGKGFYATDHKSPSGGKFAPSKEPTGKNEGESNSDKKTGEGEAKTTSSEKAGSPASDKKSE